MRRKVSVIVPTARRGDLLRDCLDSLRQQTFCDFETVLVSDGAGDWVRDLSEEYGCTLLNLPNNRGFAVAVNAGIAATRSQYVAFLNDDVRLNSDWLSLTTSLLDERPEIGFCCGKILQADGIVLDNAGDAVSLAGSAWRLGYGRRDAQEFDLPKSAFAFPGTAALLRRDLVDQIGGLDEDFVAYLEDVDLSLRAARQGLRGFYLPQAKSFHWGGATSGGPESPDVFRLLTQNQLMILAKDYPWQLWLRFGPRIAWAQLLWCAMAIRKNKLGAYLAGLTHFFKLLPAAIQKRRPWRKENVRAFVAQLKESEREIFDDISSPDRNERDAFWRMYFFLFPPCRSRDAAAKQGLGSLPVR